LRTQLTSVVDKIKRKLVENAKVKKSYQKLKAREEQAKSSEDEDNHTNVNDRPRASSPALHPSRQAMINGTSHSLEAHISDNHRDEEDISSDKLDTTEKAVRNRRPKQQPFTRDQRIGELRKEEMNKRREQREAAQAERSRKLADRERWRKTMAKARRNGQQRKLGKESTVLLEKVKRLVGA
jgi:hypothetical protein